MLNLRRRAIRVRSRSKHILLFARSLGHRAGAGSCALRLCDQNSRSAPFWFRPPPPAMKPAGSPLRKLLPLATRLHRDLGAAPLCAPSGCVSRASGQKGETPCRPKRPSCSSPLSATQPATEPRRRVATTPPLAVSIFSDDRHQTFHYNVVAFGKQGHFAKPLQKGTRIKLVIQAQSQPDNMASIPLLTATFVRPVRPAARRISNPQTGQK